MAQCVSLIRYSHQFTEDPGEIALRLNRYFTDANIDRQLFVTAILGILDTKTCTMHLVRAGHNPPITIPGKTNKAIKELTVGGLGIGLQRDQTLFTASIKKISVQFAADDVLLLYTDGLVEAAKPALDSGESDADKVAGRGEMRFYSDERLMRLLSRVRSSTAAQIQRAILADISEFYHSNAPVDDYTILLLRKK
jgi:sigma-B regulation protein RsbU (phosphoserine phosphatase)